ncbi:periplasmic heavy metal sensor [Henriciella litoralis]|uniref:periplasmic heavy metal sensor n=1 Tax=Henriciella litoralis TaxID=568102 RepID=UPI000A01B6D1|nr:periplasmic heavy metal sensor [Henriciella litoralis]
MSALKRLSPLAIALAVSLIANALLVGLVLGDRLAPRSDHRGPPRGGGGDFTIARGIDQIVPEGERNEIRQAFRSAFMDSRERFQDKREARDALTEALAQTPYNKTAVDQAFERMRRTDTELTRSFQTVLSEQLSGLSDAQRAELVTWLEEVESRRQERRERRGHWDGNGRRESPDGPMRDRPSPPLER